jgi:VWFA-related protein
MIGIEGLRRRTQSVFWKACVLAAGAMVFGVSACETAQAQDATFTLSVRAQVVTVPVTVRDSKGKLLQDLTKEDFQLSEDGQPQRIRYLTVDRDRALTLGLLVDTSGSQRDYIKKERAAAKTFFETMLTRPGDTAFLVRFDNAITMLQKPTASKDELTAGLGHLEDPHPWRVDNPGGTLFYDALDLTCERITRDVDGRNAVIVLTDGDDNGSVLTLEQTIAAAQVSNTVIYSILYTDESNGFLGSKQAVRARQVLERLSTETGGHMYQVSAREPLEKIFADIADEMRTQYVLAYSPAKGGAGSEFRKIQLAGRDKSWKIQTRSGYYYSGMN